MDEAEFKVLAEFKRFGKLPNGLTRREKFIFLRRAKSFAIENDILYYVRKDGTLAKVLSTKECAQEIFEQFHSRPIGAHCGIQKTLDAISKRFYWPGMSVNIKHWVTHCAQCQKNPCSLKNLNEYTPIEVAQPWDIVGMDLVGKLTPTEGYQYICVMVDYFTKWCEAFPLKTKSAEEVTTCIIKHFYKFGAPKRLLTDQGTEFVNKINLGVCQTLGIKRSLCAPYHPQTNGLVERLNGTIQRSLSKLVENRPSSWADYLEATMFGLRTKKQITTKFAPYYLLFGREARYPCEVPESYEINESVEEMVAEECVSEWIKRQDRLYQIVKDNMAQVQKQVRKRKLEKGKAVVMQVGDRVLRQNKRSQQRKGGKLDPDYFGPYTVTKVDGKSVDLLDEYGKILPRVNLDHLVPFLEDPPPKSRKVTTSITTTSTNTLHGTVLSIPHTTTTLTPTLTLIYPITLPVPLQNILCPPLQPPASSAPLQPVASSAPLQPACPLLHPCNLWPPLHPCNLLPLLHPCNLCLSAPLQPAASSAPLQPAASSAPLQPVASSAPLQPVASSAPLQPVASSAPLQPAGLFCTPATCGLLCTLATCGLLCTPATCCLFCSCDFFFSSSS
ncbi:hypothetical protein M9458_052602 [Cirrhinus mrigala]|uniref:Gypsy retrotransposon integrase-like protein 1 n=1 Tax=Cirrhinus mrigala TaxID=683832 RepID=A0ABD0MR81_CIRMR